MGLVLKSRFSTDTWLQCANIMYGIRIGSLLTYRDAQERDGAQYSAAYQGFFSVQFYTKVQI